MTQYDSNTDPQYAPPDDDEAIPLPVPGKRPDDSQLAARWIVYNRLTKFGLGEWRRYKNGIWVPIDKDLIKREIKSVIDRAKIEGVKNSAGLVASVLELARIDVAISSDQWDASPDFLPCKNGVLHIPTKSLLPHTPDIYATSQLNFDYDPAAECPNFMHALGQIPDAAEFLQEFAGYSLTPDVKHEIAVWLQGAPGTGKSTVLTGLQAMLGARAGLLGLADVERSRFALANLPGKTLVVSSEQPDNFITASHILNALISGEPITVEQKFKDAIIVTPRVKIIWAMNNLPRVNDANNGIMRRVKVIKFPLLDESARDPELKDKIMLEGAGILNWALQGLDHLRARGKFIIPQCVQEATHDFQEKNDIAKLFLDESGATINLLDPDCETSSQELYDRYNDWCRRNGHKPMSSTKVAEEWRRMGFTKVPKAKCNYWQGVKFDPLTIASQL
jgi:putative DNA primase/helicase